MAEYATFLVKTEKNMEEFKRAIKEAFKSPAIEGAFETPRTLHVTVVGIREQIRSKQSQHDVRSEVSG